MENKHKDKINKYEDFLENTLKVDLKEIEATLEKKAAELQDWNDVKRTAKLLKLYKENVEDSLHLLTPLFSDGNYEIHGTAEVEHLDTLLINIGCDCSLEMDLDEATKYADIRIKLIDKQIEHYRKLAVKVKVNIKATLLAINELNPIENIKF